MFSVEFQDLQPGQSFIIDGRSDLGRCFAILQPLEQHERSPTFMDEGANMVEQEGGRLDVMPEEAAKQTEMEALSRNDQAGHMLKAFVVNAGRAYPISPRHLVIPVRGNKMMTAAEFKKDKARLAEIQGDFVKRQQTLNMPIGFFGGPGPRPFTVPTIPGILDFRQDEETERLKSKGAKVVLDLNPDEDSTPWDTVKSKFLEKADLLHPVYGTEPDAEAYVMVCTAYDQLGGNHVADYTQPDKRESA